MNYHAATGPLVPSAPLPITSDMDKMFNDLGLDTFVSKTADATASNGQHRDASAGVTPSVSSNSLSEKQRMARQQEQSQRLQNATELIAQTPFTTVGPAGSASRVQQAQKPIDLTSKLIDSNLNQIKSPTGMNNMGNSNISSGDNNSSWGAMTSATTSANSGGTWNANFSTFNSMGSGTGMGAGSAMAASNSMMSPTQSHQWGGTTGSNTSNSNNNSGSAQNWSALDNLLPTKPQKTPMNQMGGQQPLLMSHSQMPPNTGGGGGNKGPLGANQLSQQDIMEFLG